MNKKTNDKPVCSIERCPVDLNSDYTTCPKCSYSGWNMAYIKSNEDGYKCEKCGYEWQITKKSRLKITEALINKINEPEPNVCLTIKTIKDKKYVYKQEITNSKQEEKCLGNVENEEVKQLVRDIIDSQLERAIIKWQWLLKKLDI